MSWNISIGGTKHEAKISAVAQSDKNIEQGYQTEAQKALVLAVIEASTGTHVTGYVGGHNGVNSCEISVKVDSATPQEA